MKGEEEKKKHRDDNDDEDNKRKKIWNKRLIQKEKVKNNKTRK